MPSVVVKLYNVFFKFLLKHRLQNRIQTQLDKFNPVWRHLPTRRNNRCPQFDIQRRRRHQGHPHRPQHFSLNPNLPPRTHF
ncbi:hypothetical protein EV1_046781 [Malus domestica]